MAEKRVSLNVDLPAEAQGKLRDYCDRKGVIQRSLLGRLIEFFISAPGPVRRVIEVGDDMDQMERDAYKAMLAELAKRLDVTPSVETGIEEPRPAHPTNHANHAGGEGHKRKRTVSRA
jgi:hypothetical protein